MAIKLEKFEKSDYERLINWIDSEELLIIFSGGIFSFPLTHKQLDTYLEKENRLVYKVIDTKTNIVIGHAELNNINYKSENARICRVLVGEKKTRNIGYGTLIITALIKIGFEELKLHRLDLGVYDFNKQAIKCYKKCGFEIEGLLKENIKVGKEYWSTYTMSIINNKI